MGFFAEEQELEAFSARELCWELQVVVLRVASCS
jgi:hypothetical protein